MLATSLLFHTQFSVFSLCSTIFYFPTSSVFLTIADFHKSCWPAMNVIYHHPLHIFFSLSDTRIFKGRIFSPTPPRQSDHLSFDHFWKLRPLLSFSFTRSKKQKRSLQLAAKPCNSVKLLLFPISLSLCVSLISEAELDCTHDTHTWKSSREKLIW